MNGDTSTRSRRGMNVPLLTVECSVASRANGMLVGVDCTPTREQYLRWIANDEQEEPATCKGS